MKTFIVVAVILLGLCPVLAGEGVNKVYTNQDLEKYKTGSGSRNGTGKMYRNVGFSKCYALDSLSQSQLKSFLGELDMMQEHYTAKSESDRARQGVLKSIRACREKVEEKLRATRDRSGDRGQRNI